MFKRIIAAGALAVGMSVVAAPEADAGVFYRAPVRRVAARTVLPPYPAARRVVARPVVVARPAVVARPVVGPVYRAPVVYGAAYAPAYGPAYTPVYSAPAPVVYGGGVSVNVGW